ncbi:TatD family hydrolase [Desulfomarina sp.]
MERKTGIIDTHCHLNHSLLVSDLDGILFRSRKAGVTDFVIPGYRYDDWQEILSLCRKKSYLHPALGLHPLFPCEPDALEVLRNLCEREKVVAVGEIGLDFQHGHENFQQQQENFRGQLEIAENLHLPILLHVRKAHDQVLAVLRRSHFSYGGIVHAFNGSRQQAEIYLRLGFVLGYGGMLTWARARKIRKLAAELPLEAIVLETDAPDMVPADKKGLPNSPEYLPDILNALSSLRSESAVEIARQTSANAKKILKLQTAACL